MGVYSIRQLEQLSGIKAHTIRIWELRFNLLKAKTVKEIAFVNELTKHYFGFLIYQKSILEFL